MQLVSNKLRDQKHVDHTRESPNGGRLGFSLCLFSISPILREYGPPGDHNGRDPNRLLLKGENGVAVWNGPITNI